MSLKTNEIYNENCLEGLKKIDTATVDLVIADPPFDISFSNKSREGLYNRKKGRVLEGYIEASGDYLEFSQSWISECSRILKDEGSFYIISGFNRLGEVCSSIKAAGLHLLDQIIWEYQFPVCTKKRFITSHYNIFFCCKNPTKHQFNPYARFASDEKTSDGRKAHYVDRSSVWYITRENWAGYKTTRTRLPRELVQKMIVYGTAGNRQLVVDPFVGSGQVPFIARELGHEYIGFELSKNHYEFAKERLDSNRYKIKI